MVSSSSCTTGVLQTKAECSRARSAWNTTPAGPGPAPIPGKTLGAGPALVSRTSHTTTAELARERLCTLLKAFVQSSSGVVWPT